MNASAFVPWAAKGSVEGRPVRIREAGGHFVSRSRVSAIVRRKRDCRPTCHNVPSSRPTNSRAGLQSSGKPKKNRPYASRQKITFPIVFLPRSKRVDTAFSIITPPRLNRDRRRHRCTAREQISGFQKIFFFCEPSIPEVFSAVIRDTCPLDLFSYCYNASTGRYPCITTVYQLKNVHRNRLWGL